MDIKDKNIAIVGNASSIIGSNNGKLIDSYDIVIILNFGYVYNDDSNTYVNIKDLCKKTDIVCAAEASKINLNRYPGLIHVIHMSSKFRTNSTYEYPIEYWKALKKSLSSRPSTGIMAFDMVERAQPSAISLFGFDWKETTSYYNLLESTGNPIGPHNWQAEKDYMQLKININNRYTIIR